MEAKSPPTIYGSPSFNSKPNKPLAAKLSRVLNSSTSEDAKIKAALTALSDISDLDEVSLRRNLQGTIERKEIKTNKRFLGAFEKVVVQFDKLELQLSQMETVCQDMKQRLVTVESQTANMIEQANIMQKHSSACNTQIVLVDRFLEKFTLTQQEIKLLSSSSEPISHEFFDALEHLHAIHNDCQLLLTTKHQTAGRDIIESMAQYQETAYEKLHRWTQYESRTCFGGDSIDVSTLMTKSLRALMLRPVLFQTIIDEIASARHDAVARAFMNALTRGGPGGTPRPIELQAPDPLRYIGDMLAWVHQACASEKEMLDSLFQLPNQSTTSTPVSVSVKDTIDDLLGYTMEGIVRPLRSRMEQVLVLQPGAITSYKVANLIQFYTMTLSKLMRKNSTLERVLHEMTELAYKYFFKTLSAQADRLIQSAEPPERSLSITPAIRKMTIQLKEILASYDSSLIISTTNTEEFSAFDFSEILDAIIEPLINACELSVAKLDKLDQDVYIVNCLHHIQTVMAPYTFTKQKRESIAARTNDLLTEMASEEFQQLLDRAGLLPIKKVLDTRDPDTPLSSLPHMDTASLTEAMSKFDSFLVLMSADVSPQLDKLSSTQHYQQVQSGAISLLLDTYKKVSQQIHDPKNGYPDPAQVLPRTVKDMEAIFSFALE
ncbi:Conserved oligomeric Golgi complex subunit 6 [Choanephora cucurbitarum]|uniref:Conserved oligomeric Golgi complex subunit 6 n=1 Tax=Choanephora cucurbitarum TaxID=101091 RepID=A0A1C7MYK9_9FUNG|nr:Conserved oligomeric Golgi complex subunit 6 [Choanephora cucurbitarum]